MFSVKYTASSLCHGRPNPPVFRRHTVPFCPPAPHGARQVQSQLCMGQKAAAGPAPRALAMPGRKLQPHGLSSAAQPAPWLVSRDSFLADMEVTLKRLGQMQDSLIQSAAQQQDGPAFVRAHADVCRLVTNSLTYAHFLAAVSPNAFVRSAAQQTYLSLCQRQQSWAGQTQIHQALKKIDQQKLAPQARLYVQQLIATGPVDSGAQCKAPRHFIEALQQRIACREQEFLQIADRSNLANRSYGTSVLSALLEARHALAEAHGHKSFANFVTAPMLPGSRLGVEHFLDTVAQRVAPVARAEAAQILRLKQQRDGGATTVSTADIAHFGAEIRGSGLVWRGYLPLDRAIDAALKILRRQFGFVFSEVVQEATGQVDVRTFAVSHGGNLVATVYLDLYARPAKAPHAALYLISEGCPQGAKPSYAMVCGLQPTSAPSICLEHRDLVRLFHEFGHLLHVLSAVPSCYPGQTALHRLGPFVEVPALLFEAWAYDPDVLGSIAYNAQGTPIAPAVLAHLQRRKGFGRGLQLQQELGYSALSLALHDTIGGGLDLHTRARHIFARYAPYHSGSEEPIALRFTHLAEYSALYYVYVWSRMTAVDLLTRFEADGMHAPSCAQALQQTVLSAEALEAPQTAIQRFLQRPPSQAAFWRWLAAGSDAA